MGTRLGLRNWIMGNTMGSGLNYPSDISGLVVRTDFTDLASLTIDGSNNISQANDKSGNGYHLTQSNASYRPVYYASGGSNDKPFARFAGPNKQLINNTVTQAQPYTFLMIFRPLSYTQYRSYLQFNTTQSNNTNGFAQGTGAVSTVNSVVASGNWYHRFKNTLQLNTWSCEGFIVNGTSTNHLINGTGNYAQWGGITSPGTGAISVFSIGGLASGANFDCHECVLYNRVLTGDELGRIYAYYKSKYSIIDKSWLIDFGDSITYGSLATGYYGFAYLLNDVLGTYIDNHGVQSTGQALVITQTNNWLGENSALPKNSYIIIADGTNNTIDETWYNNYRTIVSNILNHGFDRNRLALVTPPYQVPRITQNELIKTYLSSISSEFGTKYADCVTPMSTMEGQMGDTIHPNDTGHSTMRDIILTSTGW